jgi:hypothetical protein
MPTEKAIADLNALIKADGQTTIEDVISNAAPSTSTECTDKPVSATEGCNMLSVAEGSGSYTQINKSTGAAGRYQFMKSTALERIQKIRPVANISEANALWNKCKQSSTQECKQLQDEMCKSNLAYIERSLTNRGIPLTNANRYLAWNQGTGGASVILKSLKTGLPVTNPTVLRNMKGQAWEFSENGKIFYDNMVKHISDRGVDTSDTKDV